MTPRRPPGYMSEEFEFHISGPPLYRARTDKPVEHVTLRTAEGELMGYIHANDEDDAAGWQPASGAIPTAQNHAAPWMRNLQAAKTRGLKPSASLDELLCATHPSAHIAPGLRSTSANLAARAGRRGE